jgi:Trypsin-like peptidase domain/TPR repeat
MAHIYTLCALPPTMTRYSTSRALLLIVLVFLQTSLQADSIPDIVAKAKPAIVEIVTNDATGKAKTLGTGFFVSPDGLLVTNQHVIEGANSISAISNNGSIFLFEHVVAHPPGVDIAILKFHATDVPFLKLGQSTTAVEGQKVIVIGNPTGLMGTVSDGIISAFRENRSMIQISAPISHGSSGSPVMDENGQVIGVATLISAEVQNLNFAIPVEQVSAALANAPSERVAGSQQPIPTPTPSTNANASDYCTRGRDLVDLAKDSLGSWMMHPGSFEEAISDLTEAIRLNSNYTLAYKARGEAYYLHGDYDKAITDYNEAIRLDPNDDNAYSNRGFAYFLRGQIDNSISDYKQSISDYTEAVRISPAASFYEARGNVYLLTGERKKAHADFATAKRLKAGQ